MISQIEVIYIIIILILSLFIFVLFLKVAQLLSFDRYIFLLSLYARCGKLYNYTYYSNIYLNNTVLICINITSIDGNLTYSVRYLVAARP
ncbi:hypothetical protein TUZN_0653 [Thermoproteus uzoniensis 768-20]|uniref:Uncharacterized protein n=1 Tax=Thermoproteus uzoniensis (strain 768-20) TaxID=999630 RepID=F2L489_THEU7|nr:hypothetical protein TUZN_0653 [Thermoproteus uzoniensis 768-20]